MIAGEKLRAGPERFEAIYAASPDPWGYRSSAYEQEKYAATLAAIGQGPFDRGIEVGCSIGVFTRLLAPRCRRLMAMDFSSRALALAAETVGNAGHVEFVRGTFPEEMPAGEFDLVVCSEVLYYLDEAALMSGLEWLRQQLAGGATVVAVSWRGAGATEPLEADHVHDVLGKKLARWHDLDSRHDAYRLDRFAAGHGR